MSGWAGIVGDVRGHLSEQLGYAIGDGELDFLQVPQMYSDLLASSQPLEELLDDAFFTGFEPNAYHHALAQLPVDTFVTTNSDVLLEEALGRSPFRAPVEVLYRDDQISHWSEAQKTNVLKLHGTITDHRSIVFTEDQYLDRYAGDSLLFQLVRTDSRTRFGISHRGHAIIRTRDRRSQRSKAGVDSYFGHSCIPRQPSRHSGVPGFRIGGLGLRVGGLDSAVGGLDCPIGGLGSGVGGQGDGRGVSMVGVLIVGPGGGADGGLQRVVNPMTIAARMAIIIPGTINWCIRRSWKSLGGGGAAAKVTGSLRIAAST
jgi:hypothetical protein